MWQDRHVRDRGRTAAHALGARGLVGVRMCSSDWEGPFPLLSSARMREGPLCRPGRGTETPGQGLGRIGGWPHHHSAEPLGPVTHGSGERSLFKCFAVVFGHRPWTGCCCCSPVATGTCAHTGPVSLCTLGLESEARSRRVSPWLLTVPPTHHGVRDEFWRLHAPDEPCARQMA